MRGSGIHIDEELIEEADKEYTQYTVDELREISKTNNMSPLVVGNYIPDVSLKDIQNIANLLDKRVKNV